MALLLGSHGIPAKHSEMVPVREKGLGEGFLGIARVSLVPSSAPKPTKPRVGLTLEM